jgi:hypothetical protein
MASCLATYDLERRARPEVWFGTLGPLVAAGEWAKRAPGPHWQRGDCSSPCPTSFPLWPERLSHVSGAKLSKRLRAKLRHGSFPSVLFGNTTAPPGFQKVA